MSRHYAVENYGFFGMDTYDLQPLDGQWWRIQNPGGTWGFKFECDDRKYRVVPRDKAETDFASVPYNGILWKVIGPPTGFGKGRAFGPAAVVHDEPYTTGQVQQLQESGLWVPVNVHRHFADDLFDAAMRCRVEVEREVIVEIAVVKKRYVIVDVDPWRRNMMHLAVRMGGRSAWSKHGHPLD